MRTIFSPLKGLALTPNLCRSVTRPTPSNGNASWNIFSKPPGIKRIMLAFSFPLESGVLGFEADMYLYT